MFNISINPVNKKVPKISLIWLIVATIVISIIMVFISLYVFYKSSAYTTVKQIRSANQQLAQDDLQDYDTKSPVQSNDLEEYADSIKSRIKVFNDQEDFSQEFVDPKQLGL